MRRPVSLPRDRVALFSIDMQEEHRQDRRLLVDGFDVVVSNVARLQRSARAHQVPLYHFAYMVDMAVGAASPLHPVLPDGRSAFSDKDDPLSAVCREVGPVSGEPLLMKTQASAFAAGDLAGMLRMRGVEWLVVAGVWTEACIDATVREAVHRGFRVILVKDACGSGSTAMHQTGILNLANRLYGGAVTDTDQACRLLAGEAVAAWVPEEPVPMRYSYEDAAELYAAL